MFKVAFLSNKFEESSDYRAKLIYELLASRRDRGKNSN